MQRSAFLKSLELPGSTTPVKTKLNSVVLVRKRTIPTERTSSVVTSSL
jgi:hypothetical protein